MKTLLGKNLEYIFCELDDCYIWVYRNGNCRFSPKDSESGNYLEVTADVDELWQLICEGGDEDCVKLYFKKPFGWLAKRYFESDYESKGLFNADVSADVMAILYSLKDAAEFNPQPPKRKERHKIVVFKI
jgi:hypothetical protein